MPSASEIPSTLHTMAQRLAPLAAAWHVVIVVAIAAMLAGWRPSRRIACGAAVVLLASVAVAASVYGNPFNTLSFAMLALGVALLGERQALRDMTIATGPLARVLLGAGLVTYGLCYPHFVGAPWYRVLWAAPLGVVPCPTLAVVAGVVIAADGFGSRALPGIVALWTLIYAYVGIVRLDVFADAGLVVATLGLLTVMVRVDPAPATRHKPGGHGRHRGLRTIEQARAHGEGGDDHRGGAIAFRIRRMEVL